MKKIKYLLTFVFASLVFMGSALANGGSISVSSSSSNVQVGSTFTVTIRVSCNAPAGWKFGVSYDSSYISLQSGDTYPVFEGDGSTSSKTYSYTFKALKSGSAGVRISGTDFVDWDSVSSFTPSTGSTTVNIKTKADIEASYSKDNNLKSLSVDGFEISPAFSKDVTDYTVEVPETIEKITVNASVNDSRASVRGTGEVEVSEGNNKIEVVVTAQNGSTKTYTIEVTVKDLNPITVQVDGKNYTVVKKESLLTAPSGYNATTIKISDQDVPAFTGSPTNFTLVGLKDETGKIDLFIYNTEKNTYKKYNELKGSRLILYPMSSDEIPMGFKKGTVKIGGNEYEAFRYIKDKNIILIYAMNIEDGTSDYYLYDKDNHSYVKYDPSLVEMLYEQNKDFKLYMIVLGALSFILFILCIALGSKNKKLKRYALRLADNHVKKNDVEVTDDFFKDDFDSPTSEEPEEIELTEEIHIEGQPEIEEEVKLEEKEPIQEEDSTKEEQDSSTEKKEEKIETKPKKRGRKKKK